MLRIGLEIDWLTGPDRSGLTTYVLGLLTGFRQAGLQKDVTLYLHRSKKLDDLHPAARMAVSGYRVASVGPSPRFAWRLRMAMTDYGKLDVFQVVTSRWYPPIRSRINSYTIPDLTFLTVADCHTPANRDYWQGYCREACSSADLVITYSEHTRRDVIRLLAIPQERVAAIPLGYDSSFHPMASEAVAARLRPLGLVSDGYLLTVGTLEPRKNHVSLFRAYAILKSRGLTRGLPLVVAGGHGWGCAPILSEIDNLGLTEDIRVIGRTDDLPALYGGAAVLIYPSRYEGFGLPPLEAMACGTPVVASSATSIPEVVGDAGLLVHPDDIDAMAMAIAHALQPEVSARLSEAGISQAKRFSWKRCAEQMLATYQRATRSSS